MVAQHLYATLLMSTETATPKHAFVDISPGENGLAQNLDPAPYENSSQAPKAADLATILREPQAITRRSALAPRGVAPLGQPSPPSASATASSRAEQTRRSECPPHTKFVHGFPRKLVTSCINCIGPGQGFEPTWAISGQMRSRPTADFDLCRPHFNRNGSELTK